MLFAAHEKHLKETGVKGYHLIVGSSNEKQFSLPRDGNDGNDPCWGEVKFWDCFHKASDGG